MANPRAVRSRRPRLVAGLASCIFGLLLCSSPTRADFIPGIDISHWQGTINWTSVKNAGIKFAFMKATQGTTYSDPTFATNIQNATDNGILVGPYHFCDLNTDTANLLDPVNEANWFLSKIKPYYQTGMYLPPVADVEGFPTGLTTSQLKTLTSTWVQAFSDTIYDSLGVRPIIYTSKSKANSYYTADVAGSHELWLAWWRTTGLDVPPVDDDTMLWNPWLFWQWTSTGSVSGISGNVDRDVFSGTLDELNSLLVGYDGAASGDYNRDATIDAADYVVWRKTTGQTVPLYSGADGNGTAQVNSFDYTVWNTNFGQGGGIGSGSAAMTHQAVPEPGSLGLIVLGASFLAALAHVRRQDRLGGIGQVALSIVTMPSSKDNGLI